MAITNSDGSIILSTKINTGGISSGLNRISSLSEIAGKRIEKSFKSGKNAINAFSSALNSLEAKLSLIFVLSRFSRFSAASSEFAIQTEASVQRLVDIYGSASDAVGDFIDLNSRALGMSKAAAASFSSVYGNLFSVFADQETNAKLTNEYLKMTAVVASKTGRTVEDVQERVRSGLLGNTEAIEDLGIFVNVKTIEMTDAFQRMADGKSWQQLDTYTQQQIRSMAILEQATAKYGDETADTSIVIKNEFKASYEDFQNTWGQFINTFLLPTLQLLTQIFDVFTSGMNSLMGKSGEILENAEANADGSKETADNIKDQADNQKELNKEMKKTLAGFDDIQILSSQTEENIESAGGNGDFEISYQSVHDGKEKEKKISETLLGIMAAVSFALIAVGLILLFTGQIGWGIGFIIAGASTLSIVAASASEFDYGGIIQMITTIMGVAGGALLALGIILLWVGGIVGKPVAIGMIIAGASLLVGSVALQGGISPRDVESWLSLIMGIAGGALLALGIILCMVGSVPLGVGMIVVGSVALVAAVALNFDFIVNAIRGTFGKIMAIISAAMIIIGVVLICSGVAMPLGIGLLAAGAAGMVSVVALNWSSIIDTISSAFRKIKEWVLKNGSLIIGIILAFSGVLTPLGIALIADYMKSKSTGEKPMLWDNILNSIKTTWKQIKDYWNANIANVWTLKFWLDLAKIAGNGLANGFELAINGIISAFESMINWIINALNKISFDIPDWLGGGTFGINIKNVDFGKVKIPRLAQGAVIPPNKEFLAVLGDQKRGTNIEAPLETIVEAMNIALQNSMGGQTSKEEHYYLNETELMSIVYKLVKGGERLRGDSFVVGGVF